MTGKWDSDRELTQLARLRAALEASGDVVYDWDLATDRLTWNGCSALYFGADEKAVPTTGEALNARVNPEDLPRRMRALSDHFSNQASYECEYRIRSENGSVLWIHDRGSARGQGGGSPQRLIGILRNITARKHHEERLEYLANFDDLTGHFNKRRLREALELSLAHANRFNHPAAFLMVGIDQLGMINTAYGFEVGDAVLVEIANRLDGVVRGSDVIGRPGGDRFGVILSQASLDEARQTAERILQSLRAEQVRVGEEGITISASVGIVEYPVQSKTSFDVMAKAESAMLQGKAKGRDCFQVFEMSEQQRHDYRVSISIGESVKAALRENRLALAFQPVVGSLDHEVHYHECLVRLFDREGRVVPAAEFIPVVEQLGLIRGIDRHVLELAMDTLERYPKAMLAINISGLTATDRSWLRVLLSRLKGDRTLANRLMIEITETAALQDIEESARFVATIRNLGCKVALDDFGAGYTTFRHMKALTVDVVKIDGSFVRGITNSEENQMFIRNLVSLAKTLDLETVAECVETIDEVEFLAKQGIGLLQGYYFGKPDLNPPWSEGLSEGEELSNRILRLGSI